MWMQIKQLLTGPNDVSGEISEDMWLMRGSCGSERQSKSLTQFEDVYSRHHKNYDPSLKWSFSKVVWIHFGEGLELWRFQ